MRICNDCGKIFSDDAAKSKPGDVGECRGRPFQFPGYIVCPECESEDFETARRCSMCGDFHSELYYEQQSAIGNGDLQVCKDCRQKVLKEFAIWKAALTPMQAEVLADAFSENAAF